MLFALKINNGFTSLKEFKNFSKTIHALTGSSRTHDYILLSVLVDLYK